MATCKIKPIILYSELNTITEQNHTTVIILVVYLFIYIYFSGFRISLKRKYNNIIIHIVVSRLHGYHFKMTLLALWK